MAGIDTPAYRGPTMLTQPLTNLDLLAWFSEEERNECSSCGRRACVTLPDVAARFCLACGAIHIGGMRLDMNRQVPV
jgi:hypothetical protein